MYLNNFQSIWPQVLHQVPFTAAKFEVATSNDLGGNIFTIKYIIRPLTLGSRSQGHTKCWPVPSTACDLCSYKIWSCYGQQFRRRYNYKKPHSLMDKQTDFGTKFIYPFFLMPFRWFIQEGLLSVTSESMCTNYWLTACSSRPGKIVVRWTDRLAMTIAVDLWRKATKQTNKYPFF